MSTDLLTQLKALHLYGMAQAWSELRAEAMPHKQAPSPETTVSQLVGRSRYRGGNHLHYHNLL